jgi:hypothetical protein
MTRRRYDGGNEAVAARADRVGETPACYLVEFRRADMLLHYRIAAGSEEDAVDRARVLAGGGVEHFLVYWLHDEAEHRAGGNLNDATSRYSPAVYAAARQREIERDLAGVPRP